MLAARQRKAKRLGGVKVNKNQVIGLEVILLTGILVLIGALSIVTITQDGSKYPEDGKWTGNKIGDYLRIADAEGRKHDYSYCSELSSVVGFHYANPTPTPKVIEHFTFETSPDGEKAVVGLSDRGIWETSIDGTIRTQLTFPVVGISDHHPSYSPDAGLIAFSRRLDGQSEEIWIMNKDGSNPHLVARFDDPGLISHLNFNESDLIFVLRTQNSNNTLPNIYETRKILVSLDGSVNEITEDCKP